MQLCGTLAEIRERWTPDGSLAVIASLIITRPQLGAARATSESMQPIPLRASDEQARELVRQKGREIVVTGRLRRRYYRRREESHWGQVEVWVDECRPADKGEQDGVPESKITCGNRNV